MAGPGRATSVWRGTAGAALLLLVLGATWPGRLPGATVGVEVLLVCAGALLAQALLVERERSPWDVAASGLRLLVVPLVALVAIALAVQRWVEVARWESLLGGVRAAIVTPTNVDEVAPGSPLAPFWVVALLVQAALVVLVLSWVARRGAGTGVVVALLSLASFGWWTIDPAKHLGARFWVVGLGVLVALAIARRAGRAVPRALAALAWGAAPVIGAVAVLMSDGVLLTVVGAVVGVVLVVAALAPGSPAGMLGARCAGGVAAVAWVLFCWAAPALGLAPSVVGHELGLRDRAALLLLVVTAAGVAVVGLNALRHVVTQGFPWAVVAGGVALGAFLVTGPGLDRVEAIESDVARVHRTVTADLPACFGATQIASRLDGVPCENPALAGTTDPPPEHIGRDFKAFIDCWSRPYDDELELCDLGGGPRDAPRVLVLGDSHARVLFGGFRQLARAGILSVTASAKASCAWSTHPIEDESDARVTACNTWRTNLAQWLETHATEYDVIVTTAYGGRIVGPKRDRVAGLVDAWRPVAAAGVPIVALRDNPRLDDDPDECLIATDPQDWGACDAARDDVVRQFDVFEQAAAQVDGADHVDMWRYFCDEEVCPVVIGGVGVYRDHHHVSARYAETLAPFLYREIARTGVFHP